jgi:hypothetical protein
MVHQSASKRKTIITIIFLMFLLALVVAFTTFAILKLLNPPAKTDDTTEPEEIIIEEPEEPEPIQEINFQPIVDDWVNTVDGNKGIMIYDLDLEKIAGAYNTEAKFQTASLYKLFVVYEGYRRLQNGTWSRDDVAGWTRKTIPECLDLAIRESNSPCAETLWNMIGHDELNWIVQNDFGLPDVYVNGLSATTTEIMFIMKRFYEHPDITDEDLVAQMEDSFLNQPITTYDWRQGLPSGFSDRVNVYNKVGWNFNGSYWTIYDDASILDFVNEERHFIVVIMTNNIHFRLIRQFGADLESSFYHQYVLKN